MPIACGRIRRPGPDGRRLDQSTIANRQSTICFVRILIVDTYYSEFLSDLYRTEPGLATLGFHEQLCRIYATGFSVGDAYSDGLRALGWDAREVICNADIVQAKWTEENGLKAATDNIHDRRRRIVAAQIEKFRPEVLYVFEWCPLGDSFLAEMKGKVRLLAGQIASPLPENRTFAAYDLMISSFPPIVEHFRSLGMDAEYLRLAFDPRILDRLPLRQASRDVTFVGGFAPSHPNRQAWLERVLQDVAVDVFGYGLDRLSLDSPIRRHHRGGAWGMEMYRILQESKLTLNLHARIDIRGEVSTRFANNMRLYEATGVGTCLVTDAKENLRELFEPDREVVCFADDAECVEKLRYYLEHDEQRRAVAEAGHRRTLREHTYPLRMRELDSLLHSRL